MSQFTSIYTDLDSNVRLIDPRARLIRKLEMPSWHSGTTFWSLEKRKWKAVLSTSELETPKDTAK